MSRWNSLLPLLLLGLSCVLGAHYYLWARFIRDVGFAPLFEHTLSTGLCCAAAAIPAGVIASRLAPTDWAAWWLKPIYTWIGASFLLVLSLALIDVVRVGYSLVLALLPGLDADRRLLSARAGALVALTLGLGASAWAAVDGRRFTVRRVEIPLLKLPRALDGLRIVQISDLHVGPIIRRQFVEQVAHTVNQLAPDIVAITGDLVDGSVSDLENDIAPLGRLDSMFGTYFVTGNHEYHAGATEWCQHLAGIGIRVLRNEYVALGQGKEVLHLAGIDDYEGRNFDIGHGPDLQAALQGRDVSHPLVLLAHQPKAIGEAAQHTVDLQLSGHTHGGQLWPLGWLQKLGQPLSAGLTKFGETFLYVSCGTGCSGPRMRLGAPAEVTEIVLRAVG